MTSLDTLDYKIITLLRRDARMPAADIAREIGANERTIRNRIERLIALGAVRLTAVVNPDFFGYVNTVDIFLEVDTGEEDAAIKTLLEMQEISYLALGQGTKEISIEARFKDNAAMRDFLGRVLPSIRGVKVKGYALVPRIIRNIDEWKPKAEDFSNG